MRCTVVPPYVLARLIEHAPPAAADRARRTLERDQQFRTRRPRTVESSSPRSEPSPGEPGAADPPPRRHVRDAAGSTELPGRLVRREGDPPTGDAATDEAYSGLGATWELYDAAYGRDSLDGRGLPLHASVHYGEDYANAFWDGSRVVFGDGDGEYFARFTRSLEVIGHELTHGVIEHTADLVYDTQSGALNEHLADVFGSLVKQRARSETADRADWLIGAALLTDRVEGTALRSMRAPGTAYDDPVLGKDPQPASMDDYVETTEDDGGVHINSGIPNHAFFLAATAIGGDAWATAGEIWYAVLTGGRLPRDCDFPTFASLTTSVAADRHGPDSREVGAVGEAWSRVGLDPTGSRP